MNMNQYIYIDVFFLRNFFMNILCLKSLCYLLRRKCSGKRLILSGVIGAGWNLCMVISGISMPGMPILLGVLMCRIVFGMAGEKKDIVYLLLIAFSVEGSIRWFDSMNGCVLIPVICKMIGARNRKKELDMKVILSFRGRKKEMEGFYDSGNRLSEPVTGKMVHIVCYKDVEELLPECYRQEVVSYLETGILNSTKVSELQMYEFTFLSYHSIGNENGQLLGIRMDSADFISKAGKKTEEKVVIGLTKQRLFVRGQDRMIVNGRLEI